MKSNHFEKAVKISITPVKDFPIPEGIEFMKIDPKIGQVSLEREATLECFKEGIGPTKKVSSRSKTPADFFKFDFDLSTNPR